MAPWSIERTAESHYHSWTAPKLSLSEAPAMRHFDLRRAFLIAGVLLLVHGCASAPPRHAAVPSELTARAEIPGMPGVRHVVGGDMTPLINAALDGLRLEQEMLIRQGHKGPLPPAVFLAISGGGDNGAYTAGVINGWPAGGTRPEFKLVTALSSGPLIAPFAFLGPKPAPQLQASHTPPT